MHANGLTPILNVTDIQQSFAWFEKLGWKKGWDWGSPVTFGGMISLSRWMVLKWAQPRAVVMMSTPTRTGIARVGSGGGVPGLSRSERQRECAME